MKQGPARRGKFLRMPPQRPASSSREPVGEVFNREAVSGRACLGSDRFFSVLPWPVAVAKDNGMRDRVLAAPSHCLLGPAAGKAMFSSPSDLVK
ncbi:MAG: hypothetical protein N2689_13200 [Verrucomicrobiae bacterium]|nr:hypothetical protein [Verrucomicrobiae bacterium]